MSRIADAAARAGQRLAADELQRWDAESEAAARHLGEVKPVAAVTAPSPALKTAPVQQPAAVIAPEPEMVREARPQHETIDFELASAVRRIFLTPKDAVRSVLFCTVPGDAMSEVAWRAAELLASQSGQRVAFVEDGATTKSVPNGHSLITRSGWFAPNAAGAIAAGDDAKSTQFANARTERPDVLGTSISALHVTFPFVIVDATAPSPEDLVPLAREVGGVIVIVAQDETGRDNAHHLIATLRDGGAAVVGAILTTR